MSKTKIEWSEETWNPTRGCIKLSQGCKHCYAETFAERWRGTAGHAYERGFDPRTVPAQLSAPLGWYAPRQVFVDSMSDLFLDEFPDSYIAAVFGVMALACHHTYVVLTKRAERMAGLLERLTLEDCIDATIPFTNVAVTEKLSAHIQDVLPPGSPFGSMSQAPMWPLPNVRLGVSVENLKEGVPRIMYLQRTPAACRVLSVEPLLEDLGPIDLTGIGWVIVGGESGPGARPFNVDWARSLLSQCRQQRIPFFMKQVGANAVRFNRIDPTSPLVQLNIRTGKGGDIDHDIPEDLRVREMPGHYGSVS